MKSIQGWQDHSCSCFYFRFYCTLRYPVSIFRHNWIMPQLCVLKWFHAVVSSFYLFYHIRGNNWVCSMSAPLHAGEYRVFPPCWLSLFTQLHYSIERGFLYNELLWQAELTSGFCRHPTEFYADIWRMFMIDSWLEVAFCTSRGVSSEVGGFVGELGWWRECKSTACKWKNIWIWSKLE